MRTNPNLRFKNKEELSRFLEIHDKLDNLERNSQNNLFFVDNITFEAELDKDNIKKFEYLGIIELVKENEDFAKSIYLIL